MKNTLTTITLLIVIVLTAGFASAQEERMAVALPVAPVACPFPYHQHFTAGPGAPAPAPVLSEFPAAIGPLVTGSVWNQGVANKHFGQTFRFPSSKDCCVMTSATLTIHLKALQSGPSLSTSVNDGLTVYANHGVINSQALWTPAVHANDTKTVVIPITANNLTGGMVSFYVEDDTAVVSAELDVTGCCIRRP